MNFDATFYPYPSRRTVVYGQKAMVATSHPLAAQAGLTIMQQGGNAIDAAIATAACLTVVEPTSNGLGGDAFATVWAQGSLYGLNSSGPAPQALTDQWVRSQGFDAMPAHGWAPVTVPGIPGAWAQLASRFGALPLTVTLEPAIRVAREGYPVSPTVSFFWQRAYEHYASMLMGPEYGEWFRVFAPQNRGPKAGEIWSSQDHANTLEEIARSNAESFYRGKLAEQIARFSQTTGGVMAFSDLAAFHPQWVTPLSVGFHDYEVWELPPNGQGLIALMALKMLEGLPCSSEVERIHQQIECLKLAFADAQKFIADPRYMTVTAADLLADEYLNNRRKLIGEMAEERGAGSPRPGGTVYLAVADKQGNMVSYIQSNYSGFGSGLVVPNTGIALQNRGHLFTLSPGHPNSLAPGKRPYHTIIPGFLTHHGTPVGPFGVMGGFMQPQGHVQVLSRILSQEMNPQAALDAPRFYWDHGTTVVVEATMPQSVIADLERRGHQISVTTDVGLFGRGQIVWRLPSGVLIGATESRADGHVASW
ncbi:MAG: gamma-glutamyltransferase family protein [Firmicutes bacterium]|nr:gamma-glutamyltransferase family protein [Bacillota bacterium]